MVKTMIYISNGQPVAVLLRGDHEVNETKLTKVLGQGAVALADQATIEQVTHARVGFAGPCGAEGRNHSDQAVSVLHNFVTGANKSDMHLDNVNAERDFNISRVADIRYVTTGDRCKICNHEINISQELKSDMYLNSAQNTAIL